MKLTKKKVLAGALSLGIVSSVGLAFASTDAGEQLRSWYDGEFAESAASVEDRVNEYGAAKLPGLLSEYNDEREGAASDINNKKDEETSSVQSAIENAKNDHVNSLEGEKSEIMGSMLEDFNLDIYQPIYSEIETITNNAINMATNELTGHTENTRIAAVNSMTTDLEAARDEAVGELEAKINEAKQEILGQLDTYEDITVANLEGWVDANISRFRAEIYDTVLPDLVAAQQQIISDTAAELEEGALQALDDVVSGMGGADAE